MHNKTNPNKNIVLIPPLEDAKRTVEDAISKHKELLEVLGNLKIQCGISQNSEMSDTQSTEGDTCEGYKETVNEERSPIDSPPQNPLVKSRNYIEEINSIYNHTLSSSGTQSPREEDEDQTFTSNPHKRDINPYSYERTEKSSQSEASRASEIDKKQNSFLNPRMRRQQIEEVYNLHYQFINRKKASSKARRVPENGSQATSRDGKHLEDQSSGGKSKKGEPRSKSQETCKVTPEKKEKERKPPQRMRYTLKDSPYSQRTTEKVDKFPHVRAKIHSYNLQYKSLYPCYSSTEKVKRQPAMKNVDDFF